MLEREKRHLIRLMHRDAGLSIDIEEFESFETAEEYRDRLASFLNLPPMVMAGAPALAEGATETEAPQPRRGRSVRGRRPRFLMRRRPGARAPLGKVEGREIIARN